MVRVLGFVVVLLNWWRRSPEGREAEIVLLRQQLIVRTAPIRPRLKATDRLISVCLYRLFASMLGASIIFTPKTCHRIGIRLFWHWKSRRRLGCPALSADTRSLVRRMSQ